MKKYNKRVYLCGPIDSRIVADETPEQKQERFEIAQAYCEAQGWEVFNPYEFGQRILARNPNATIPQIMAKEELELAECTHIFLMVNWMHSAGCLKEVEFAGRLYIEEFAKEKGVRPANIQFMYETFETIMAGREHLFKKCKAEHSNEIRDE